MAHAVLIRRTTPVVMVALAVLMIAFVAVGAQAGSEGIITKSATGSFENTVTKLKKAITANKLVIIKEIPFTKMLGMVGVKAEKIKAFEIFHPRYGKVLYANDKNAFLEAPLRILVRDKGGKVMIRYRKPSVVFAGYSGLSDLGSQLDKVFANIIGSVAK